MKEVLDRTLHILEPESLDSPPKQFGLAQQLAHMGPEMPPTPPPTHAPAAGGEGDEQPQQQERQEEEDGVAAASELPAAVAL